MDETQGRELGFLIVGAGFLGAQRAAAATVARGVRLVAVTDCDLEAARRVAKLHGATLATDLSAGLANQGVDAVVVATPHADHASQVRQALEAGKHVLCEKPLTIDPIDARALAAMAQEARQRLATGFNHRYYRPVREALELVRRGSLGRIEEVNARIGHRADAAFLSSWHTDPDRSGGGTLLDNGPHACDLIRQLLGEVSAVEATVDDHIGLPDGCESEAHVRLQGRDGGSATLWSSWTLDDGYLTIEIKGTRGQLRVETAPWRLSGILADGTRLERSYLGARIKERLQRSWFRCETSLVQELEVFAAPQREPSQGIALATGWDGCRATEIVRAAYESARNGGIEVRLEPLPVRLPGAHRQDRKANVA